MKRLERRLCAFSRNVYMSMNFHEPKIIIPKISVLPREADNNGSLEERKKIIMDIYEDSELPFTKDAIENGNVVKKKEYIRILGHMVSNAYRKGNVEIVDGASDKEVDYKYGNFVIHFGKKKRKKMDVDIFFDTKSMTCNIFILVNVKCMMKSDEWFMNKLIKGIGRSADIFRNGDVYGRFKDEEASVLLHMASNTLCNGDCTPIIEFKF